ncbi:hypothetical protein JNUCC0626_35975 [Lentzea sp. JNUCC 0626]|uniref:hypothetical protein n=1 Tax=Lentzea sp. JNUCC 0626 TaxID=3367513 RepID=UPI003749F823
MNEAPRPVRIAVGLWLAIAVFVFLTTAGLWFQRDEVRELTKWSSGQITSFLTTVSVITLIFVVAYVLLVWQFLKRKNWPRAALSFTAIAHMIWILYVGVSASSLVTLLLICVAIVFTWQARTAQWLAEVREQ